MVLLPLFQAKIGDNHLAAGRQAADFRGDVGLFASRGFCQPSLEYFQLLFPVPPLPQLSMPLNDSAHAVLRVIDLVFL